MSGAPYSMGFSTGGLFHTPSVKLAEVYLQLQDWSDVRDQALKTNVLQTRAASSSVRSVREILQRLQLLSHEELLFLVNAASNDQNYLLWLAVCRRYQFIADFSVEVLRERFLSLHTALPYEEFDAFFHQKSTSHAELDDIRSSTRKKLRQVLFRMMREAELLTKENHIIEVHLSPGLYTLISQKEPRELEYFPMVIHTSRRNTP